VLTQLLEDLVESALIALTHMRLVLSEEFNKSVCLDLESRLIELVHGDGQFAFERRVLEQLGVLDLTHGALKKAVLTQLLEDLVEWCVIWSRTVAGSAWCAVSPARARRSWPCICSRCCVISLLDLTHGALKKAVLTQLLEDLVESALIALAHVVAGRMTRSAL
jgi:hypothetical protein